MNILPVNGITILDPTMRINEIRLLPRGIEDILRIKITNETGKHLFIECRPSIHNCKELVIKQ